MRRNSKRDTDARLAAALAELQDTQERLGTALVALLACETALADSVQSMKRTGPDAYRVTCIQQNRDALTLARSVREGGGE